MKIISIILLFIGIGLGVLSTQYDLYSDEEAFNSSYYEIDSQHEDASILFQELREQYLTPKIKLADYGLTLFQLGLVLLIFSIIKPSNIKVPGKKATIVVIGIIALLLSIGGFAGDLFLEMKREVYPHWVDSLAIPMMGMPVFFAIGLIWVAANASGLRGMFIPGVAFFPFNTNNINYWYAIIIGVTSLLLLCVVSMGYFWYVIPGFLWIYFYSSIMIGKKAAKSIVNES